MNTNLFEQIHEQIQSKNFIFLAMSGVMLGVAAFRILSPILRQEPMKPSEGAMAVSGILCAILNLYLSKHFDQFPWTVELVFTIILISLSLRAIGFFDS